MKHHAHECNTHKNAEKNNTHDTSQRSSHLVSRRQALRGIGTAAGVLSLPAASAPAMAENDLKGPQPPADEPIDRTAMTPVEVPTDVTDLRDYIAAQQDDDNLSGNLFKIPPGEYTWSSEEVETYGHDWGIQGQGEQGDVTIMLEPGQGLGDDAGFGNRLLNHWEGGNLLFENLDFDSEGRAAGSFGNLGSGPALYHRLRWLMPGCDGWTDSDGNERGEYQAGSNCIALAHEGDEILVDRCVGHNRGVLNYQNQGSRFIFASSSGDLHVRRCKYTGGPDNTIYTRMNGDMLVEHCVFANTTGGVRTGGDTLGEEVVRDCTFWIDTSRGEVIIYDDPINQRINTPGVQFDPKPGSDRAGPFATVRRCNFMVEETPNASGAIRALSEMDHVVVDDCQFMLNDEDVPGLGASDIDRVDLTDNVFATRTGSGVCESTIDGDYSESSDNFVDQRLSVCRLDDPRRGRPFKPPRVHPFPEPDDFSFPEIRDQPPQRKP